MTMKTHFFHVLLALAEESRHGSGIMREVMELTGGEVRLWPVKLYSTLEELSVHGWIEELKGDSEHPEGKCRKRRYYRITAEGRASLPRWSDAWIETRDFVDRFLALGPLPIEESVSREEG